MQTNLREEPLCYSKKEGVPAQDEEADPKRSLKTQTLTFVEVENRDTD